MLSAQDVVRVGEWIAVALYLPAEEVAFGRAVRPLGKEAIGGPALNERFQRMKRVAPTDLSVILTGETGTGKEIFARALHVASGRAGKFIALNCAAVPEALAEAELFGSRKGAYTGADRNHAGHLREACGGTLFLDEVCDLHPAVQAKLLRALHDRSVVPLGESRPVRIDVRVVSASQVLLDEVVAAGRFRPDLYARLNGAEIALPALRTRREEVVPLFMRTLAGKRGGPSAISPGLAEWLCLYSWPFNAREVVQTALSLAVHDAKITTLDVEHLPEYMTRATGSGHGHAGRPEREVNPTRAERHRRSLSTRNDADLTSLLDALEVTAGNVAAAAKRCGISRQRAYRLLESRPDIDVDGLRSTPKLDTDA
jgi:transcriptional regulator with PAS, ATPase and Fis domain